MNIPISTVAKRKRRRSADRPSATALMNLGRFASMIDLSFLLLIFFLTTTRFSRPEGLLSAPMPREGGAVASSIALPLTPIVVRLRMSAEVSGSVALSVNDEENPPRTFGELTGVLREYQQKPGFDRDTPIVLVAADEVPWDHVVSAWNAALSAGCTRIAFGDAS